MLSLWNISTDTVVTALIAVGIGALVIAWLFAGRRRPAQASALEHRRLAGREAEVASAPTVPPLYAVTPEPDAAPEVEAADPAALAEPDTPEERPAFAEPKVAAPAVGAEPDIAARTAGSAETAEAGEPPSPILVLEPAIDPASDAAPPPDPSPADPPLTDRSSANPPDAMPRAPAPRSPEQASAMSIAAALVRRDKRDPAPETKTAQAATPDPACGAGGDDLTAITGIDGKLAKEMNDLGVRYFDQIGDWSPDHAAWIASRLSSSVTNDQRAAWIAEAKALAGRSSPAGRNRASHGG